VLLPFNFTAGAGCVLCRRMNKGAGPAPEWKTISKNPRRLTRSCAAPISTNHQDDPITSCRLQSEQGLVCIKLVLDGLDRGLI